ncbi:MAG: hypothetical protein ACXAAQ_09860, partial [Candidatus Thorarchaeota archaeon]
MTNHRNKILSVIAILLIFGTASPLSSSFIDAPLMNNSPRSYLQSDVPSDQVPLRRVAFVSPDSDSYIDEFAYMATVPTSVFYHNDTQYISPLIYSEGSSSEDWFLEDWIEYLEPDGGITQAIAVGDFSETYISSLQQTLGSKVYPRITGTSAADIAAKIAVSEWGTSSVAVLALAKEDFSTSSDIVGSSTHTFEDQASELTEFPGTVNYGTPSVINFTPPTWAGWIEGAFNWTGTEILTHELIDPNGEIVDYSVYNQIFFSRHPTYVDSPVPLNFWLPKTVDGLWAMNVTRDSSGST